MTSIADIHDFRVFHRDGATTRATWVDSKKPDGTDTFRTEELEKIRRFVQQSRGEVLFSRLVVLFEGDTEEAAMPIFARAYWGGKGPDEYGVSLVNVGGAGDYKHFIPLLDILRIPWRILSDADKAGRDGVAAAGKAIGRQLDEKSTEVIMLSSEADGHDFEAYLIAEGFRPEVERAIAAMYGPTELTQYRSDLDGKPGKRGAIRDYRSKGWEERVVLDFLDKHKGSVGGSIAQQITQKLDAKKRPTIPVKIAELLARVTEALKPQVKP